MKALTTLWVLGMFLATPVLADDVEDVKAAEMAARAAEAAGNTLGFYKNMVPEFSIFPPTAGLLAHPASEENRLRTQATFDAGTKYDIQVRNLDVQVYGPQPSAPIMSWQRSTDPRGSQYDGICE